MGDWRERIRRRTADRKAKELQRTLRAQSREDGSAILLATGKVLDFCSNDYLAMAGNREVLRAARTATLRIGAGARASRLVTGNYDLIEELEAELADFKGTESALVFPTGYQANLGLLGSLLESRDAVFVDRLAHSCLVDGIRLSGARLRVFPHNDLTRLRALLERSADAPARWIVTEGVFSMDGDLAPLPGLLELAEEHDATVILDDAHGTGVLGAKGRGVTEHYGIEPGEWPRHLILTATLGKALGSQGGVVLGPKELRCELVNVARTFIYTTGLAPACAAAALAALRVLKREPRLVRALEERTSLVRLCLEENGIALSTASQSPILPILLGEPERAVACSRQLERQGVLALPIRPPTVPRGTSRIRLTVTLNHDEAECHQACHRVARAVAAAAKMKSPNTIHAFLIPTKETI